MNQFNMSPEEKEKLHAELAIMLLDMQNTILELQSKGVALPVTKFDIGSALSILSYVLSTYNWKPTTNQNEYNKRVEKQIKLCNILREVVKAWTGVDTHKIY